MKLITIILSYYNQPRKMLEKHLTLWKYFPPYIQKYFTFLIIDDASRESIQEFLSQKEYQKLDLHLFQVQEDLYCNIAGVRNLGAVKTQTPFLLMLDMDTLVNKTMAEQLVKLAQNNINNQLVFKFLRRTADPQHPKNNTFHPAVCLIRKEDYWRIGGCEEDLVGHYGYTDPCFWLRAQGKVRIIFLRDIILLYDEEGEADINRDTTHNQKIYEDRMKNNNWSDKYLRFKWGTLNIKDVPGS